VVFAAALFVAHVFKGRRAGSARRGEAIEAPQPAGVAVYAAYVTAEVAAQTERKKSLEARGVTVVTTSGALVTLLFGFASLSTKAHETFSVPHAARGWLIAALCVFAAAAILGLFASLPLNYQRITTRALDAQLAKRPPVSAVRAQRAIARTDLKNIEAAKVKNTYKAWLVFAGVALEGVGVLLLAFAMQIVIRHG
jgi:hypothetical protein